MPSDSSSGAFDPSAPANPNAGLFGLPHDARSAGVHVLNVPFDATTSYRRGAALAPRAILAASKQVDLYDRLTGRPYEEGIYACDVDERIAHLNAEGTALHAGELDRAAVRRLNAIGAEVNQLVRARCEESLEAGKLVAVLGGDHSAPFGLIAACAAQHPGMGILHFDAHADLRAAYEGLEWSHASIFHNVLERIEGVGQVVQVGVRDLCEEEADYIAASGGRIKTLFDDEWARERFAGGKLRALVQTHLALLPNEVYISFDIDGLDPTLCPNTGTPVPGGLNWPETMLWLEELMRSGKRVVGLDLNEVSPGPDGDPTGEGWDAIVGARLLYRLIGVALCTRS